eukprot:7381764-Prymnesium_polylepis.1
MVSLERLDLVPHRRIAVVLLEQVAEAQLLHRRILVPMRRAAAHLCVIDGLLPIALRLRRQPSPMRLRLPRRLQQATLLHRLLLLALELRPILAVDQEGHAHTAALHPQRRADLAVEGAQRHRNRLRRAVWMGPDLVTPLRPGIRELPGAVAAAVQRDRRGLLLLLLRVQLLDHQPSRGLQLLLREDLAAVESASGNASGRLLVYDDLLDAGQVKEALLLARRRRGVCGGSSLRLAAALCGDRRRRVGRRGRSR